MNDSFPFFNFLTTIFAGIAVIISIWGLVYAWHANSISKNALEHSKSSFSQEQRPRLTLSPSDFKGFGYIRYDYTDERVKVDIHIKLYNVGRSSAKGIKCIKENASTNILGEEIEAPDRKTDFVPVDLSPNEHYLFAKSFEYGGMEKNVMENGLSRISNGEAFIKLEVAFKYSDESLEHSYSISAVFEIRKNTTKVLSYVEEVN